MLRYRLIFGPLMIVGGLLLFWLDGRLDQWELQGVWRDVFAGRAHPPAGLVLLFAASAIIVFAARELAQLFRAERLPAHTTLISLSAIAACLAVYATPQSLQAPTGVVIVASVLIACFMITLWWHSRDADFEGVVAAAGATMFAAAYLGLMAGCYLALRRWHSPWEVLGVLLITKSCDIGAYFAGRYLGRRKLVPWLSPGKTWEGLVGGVLLAVVAAVGFAAMSQHTNIATVYRTAPTPAESELYRVDGPNVKATPAEPAAAQRVSVHRYPIGWAVIAGVVFALVGQLGDLTMSLFKRDAGVKDSGATIPGFGGVLDVVDSPLLVAPVAYWLLSAAVISVPA